MQQVAFFDEPFEMLGVEMLASGTYYPGSPGRYSGPPEDCYPAEPDEVEIEALTVAGTVDIIALVSDTVMKRCADAMRDHIANRDEDCEP